MQNVKHLKNVVVNCTCIIIYQALTWKLNKWNIKFSKTIIWTEVCSKGIKKTNSFCSETDLLLKIKITP